MARSILHCTCVEFKLKHSKFKHYYEHIYSLCWHCVFITVIVKATNGPRYVVGCRRGIDKLKLKAGTRVALDMTTLTIMR